MKSLELNVLGLIMVKQNMVMFIISILCLIIGILTTSILEYYAKPFTIVYLPNGSSITLNPYSTWSYVYVWISIDKMNISDVFKIIRSLNVSRGIEYHILNSIMSRVPSTIVGKSAYVDVVSGEPRDLAIGLNISIVKPRNASIIIEIYASNDKIRRYNITGWNIPKYIYVPLTQSGMYIFKVINNNDIKLNLTLTIGKSHLETRRPYLYYGIGFIITSILMPSGFILYKHKYLTRKKHMKSTIIRASR